MVRNWFTSQRTDPTPDEIAAAGAWLERNENWSQECGSGTGTEDALMEELFRDYAGFANVRTVDHASPCDILAALERGHPPIIHTKTRMDPGGASHWMVVTGVSRTSIWVNDPGRGAPTNGRDKEFSLSALTTIWNGWTAPNRIVIEAWNDGPSCPASADCRDRVCGLDPVCQLSCGACPPGEACTQEGTCISTCTSNCSVDGEVRCSPAGREVCVHAGACLRWQAASALETCNGCDDDNNGIVDDPATCWRAIYRFRDAQTGAHCWSPSETPPPRCASYGPQPFEAFIVAAQPLPGTFKALQCSNLTDHIITDAAIAGYDCQVELGYVYTAPPQGTTPFARACPLWRFRHTVASGTGAHFFSRGPDDVTGMTCEPPSRGYVLTSGSCFPGVPPGCQM